MADLPMTDYNQLDKKEKEAKATKHPFFFQKSPNTWPHRPRCGRDGQLVQRTGRPV